MTDEEYEEALEEVIVLFGEALTESFRQAKRVDGIEAKKIVKGR